MPKKPIHVMLKEGEWAVEREGARQPLSVHRTQAEAERAGRELARRNKTELLLHGRSGDIRKRGGYNV